MCKNYQFVEPLMVVDGKQYYPVKQNNGKVDYVPVEDCIVRPFNVKDVEECLEEITIVTADGYIVNISGVTDEHIHGYVLKYTEKCWNAWDRSGRSCIKNVGNLYVIKRKVKIVVEAKMKLDAREREKFLRDAVEVFALSQAEVNLSKLKCIACEEDVYQVNMPKHFIYRSRPMTLQNFDMVKYHNKTCKLQTRSGIPIPSIQFFGKDKLIIRGVGEMSMLQWDCFGKINGNAEHPLDLMMVPE